MKDAAPGSADAATPCAEPNRTAARRRAGWRRLASFQLLAILALAWPARADPAAAERRGREFWRELAKHCAVPEGESAAGLVDEIVSMLGSSDAEWRDGFGYGVVARCVYRNRALDAGQRRALVRRLADNLRIGIGRSEDDSVLLRSFSALDLSILAALDNEDPFLDEADFHRLLGEVLAYLGAERDLRGLDARVGWIHATAHTADGLKFLARSRHLSAAEQTRVLDALADRMSSPGAPVFTHAEDERLARVLLSLARRADFDAARLGAWLERFVALEKSAWARTPPDAAVLDASQNARNLLRSFYVLLTLPGTEATPGVLAAREKVGATLGEIQR